MFMVHTELLGMVQLADDAPVAGLHHQQHTQAHRHQ